MQIEGMKHLTLILTLFFSTLMFSSPAYADWEKVGDDAVGNTFYVDFDGMLKNNGYVYYWELQDLLEPNEYGNLSFEVYYQGDCELFRYKDLRAIYYKQSKGEGHGETVPPSSTEWKYPTSKSMAEKMLTQVCFIAGY